MDVLEALHVLAHYEQVEKLVVKRGELLHALAGPRIVNGESEVYFFIRTGPRRNRVHSQLEILAYSRCRRYQCHPAPGAFGWLLGANIGMHGADIACRLLRRRSITEDRRGHKAGSYDPEKYRSHLLRPQRGL